MGGVQLPQVDTTLINYFVGAIATLATVVGILYKNLLAKIEKSDLENKAQLKALEDRHKECEDENKTLKCQIVDLLHKFSELKEELGFLKGLVKHNEGKAQARLQAVKKG